jgi:hypothetical protein
MFATLATSQNGKKPHHQIEHVFLNLWLKYSKEF